MVLLIKDAMASIDAVVQSVKFDDSAMPYFQLALAFFVIEYTLHTYLDWRQLQVMPHPHSLQLRVQMISLSKLTGTCL